MDDVSATEAPWWVGHAKSLGLPTIFLGVLMYMIWTAGTWAGTTIIVPIFNKQMEFIDKASAMTEEMNRTTGLINKTLEGHSQHAVETLKFCQHIDSTTSTTDSEVKIMQKSHDQMLGVLKDIEENTKPLREPH